MISLRIGIVKIDGSNNDLRMHEGSMIVRHWPGLYRCLHFIVHYSALSNEISVEPTDFWLKKVSLTCGLWVGVDVARYSIHQLLQTYLWLLRGEWRALQKSGAKMKGPVFLVFNIFDPHTLFLLLSSRSCYRICMYV